MKANNRINQIAQIKLRDNEEILKLSRRTSESLEKSRKKRLKEANKDNDMFYINNIFWSFSMPEIFKILINKSLKKIRNHFF